MCASYHNSVFTITPLQILNHVVLCLIQKTCFLIFFAAVEKVGGKKSTRFPMIHREYLWSDTTVAVVSVCRLPYTSERLKYNVTVQYMYKVVVVTGSNRYSMDVVKYSVPVHYYRIVWMTSREQRNEELKWNPSWDHAIIEGQRNHQNKI